MRIATGFSEEVSDLIVIKRRHHRRISQMPLRWELGLGAQFRSLIRWHLILNNYWWILNLKLLTLNIYVITLRLLLRQNLIRWHLSNWIHLPLILRSNFLLIFNRAIEMRHIIRLILIILPRQVSIISLLVLLERRDAWDVGEEGGLLLLLLLRILIPLLLHSLLLLFLIAILLIYGHLLLLLALLGLICHILLILANLMLVIVVFLLNLISLLVLLIQLIAIPFRTQFPRIILQKHIKFVDTILDIFKVADLLILKQLILSYSGLLQHHDELLAFSDNVVWEIGPFQLRFIQHSLAIRLLFLQNKHVFLHRFHPICQSFPDSASRFRLFLRWIRPHNLLKFLKNTIKLRRLTWRAEA